jgi:hypothetical protein
VWLQKELATMPLPSELAPVPDPAESSFVRTGDYIPCSGIWEPVDVAKPSFMSLVTRAPKPQPPFKIMGAMNYLHGGSNAPQIRVETVDDSFSLDTTWRLLWRDDRYIDGTIPEEEAYYRFMKPDPVQPPAPVPFVAEETMWGESGNAAPVAGRWLVESHLDASVTLRKGERFPLHQGRKVRWVLADD